MICKWSHGYNIYEFDAKNKTEEQKKLRQLIKGRFKAEDMVKEK